MSLNRLASLCRSARLPGPALGVCALALAHVARGQTTTKPTDNVARPARSAEAAATTTVAIVPKSLQVLKLAVPANFVRDRTVTFDIRPAAGVSVISAKHGSLPVTSDERSIVLTYAVPGRAQAGALAVATVVFSDGADHSVSVPVVVNVATVRNVTVDLTQHARGIKPGAQLPLRYRIANRGNAVDTVLIRYTLPYDWHSVKGKDTLSVVLAPNEERIIEGAIKVPNAASGGSYSVDVKAASSDTSAHGSDRFYLEVPTIHQTPASKSIALNTTYSRVSGGQSNGDALLSLAFSGQVYRDLTLAMDATSSGAMSSAGKYRLANLGQFPQPPNFGISGGDWRARLGSVGASFSDLTGQGAGGRGASFTVDKPTFTIASVLSGEGAGFSSRVAGDTNAGPTVIGARVGAQVLGRSWLIGTMAHLDEGSLPGARQLNVASVGTILPSLFGGTLQSEAAFRQYKTGAGLGLFSEYTRTRELSRLQIRALVAPGGTAAYAPSNANFTGFMSQQLGKAWQLGGAAWLTSNSVSAGETARSSGLDFTPHYTLTKGTSLGLDAGVLSQTLTSHSVGFGSSEIHLSPVVNINPRPRTNFNIVGTIAEFSRGAAVDATGQSQSTTAARTELHAFLGQGTPWFGTLMLGGGVSNDQSNTVGLPRQNQLSLRLDRFPLYLPGGYNLIATGIVQRLGWFGDRPSIFTVRGDLAAELPFGLTAGVTVDRNPLTAVPGGQLWTSALHVGRTTYFGVPTSWRYGSRTGLVYQDLNGNGRRDANEPGLAGVIVRRGTEYVTSEENGAFKFTNGPTVHTERISLDPRSLPEGWMDQGSPTSEAEARKIKAIGVVPTSSIRVRLAVRREDAGAVGNLDLSAVVVTAKDASGRAYVAQTTDKGIQTFSALPPGDYSVTVDPTAAGQLQVVNAPQGFRVDASSKGQDLDIELQTRTVKIKTFQNRSPGATSPGPAPAAAPASPANATPSSAAETVARPRRSTGAAADTVSLEEARKARPRTPQVTTDSTRLRAPSDSVVHDPAKPVPLETPIRSK